MGIITDLHLNIDRKEAAKHQGLQQAACQWARNKRNKEAHA
jgi:hypothetical protein